MAAFKKGADVEALARISQNIKGMQAELTAIESSSGQAMRSIQGNWGGDNLLALVRHFNSTAMPGLRACNGVFDAMSKKLDENVAAQRGTSGQGGSGGSGSGGGGGGGGSHGSKDKPFDPEVKRGGKVDVGPDGRQQDDSRDDGNGNRYQHTADGGRHTYENTRTGEDGRERYERSTHAGDYNDRRLRSEEGWTREDQRDVNRPWLPSDDSERDEQWAKDNPGLARAKDGALTSVNLTKESEIGKVGNIEDNGLLMAGADAKSEVGIKDGALYAGATATAGAYLAKGKLSGDFSAGDLKGKGEIGGFVGAEGKADAGVSLGKDGLQAKAGAEAFAGAKGSASGSLEYGVAEVHGKGEVMAGAEAKANASVGIGKDGVKASAGAEAFAGVKAGGEVGGSVAGVGGTAGGEVYAGIGAHAKVDANFSAESVKVKVDVGAALGVGAGVNFSVDVNPTKFMDDVGLSDAAEGIEDGLSSAAKGVGGAIKGLFG